MAKRDEGNLILKGVLQLASSIDKIIASPDNFIMKFRSVYVPTIEATRALLKFCQEHQGVAANAVQLCLQALESGNYAESKKTFKAIHFGANGSFDWFPPVVFSNENAVYVQAVYDALVERWHRLMTLLLE
jgi:hypothetical protein